MPLINEFKSALIDAIDEFSKRETILTTEQADSIVDLKNVINTMDSAIHLKQEILIKLRKIPSKWYSLFPGVNDLPKAIKKVFSDSCFAESQLLIAGYGDLYAENKSLREENKMLRDEFEEFKKSGMPEEIAKSIQGLNNENIRLTTEVQQQKQAMGVLEAENKVLKTSIVTLTQDKTSLETQIEQIKKEKQELSENQILTADENRRLKEENKRLKAQLEAVGQTIPSNRRSDNNYSKSAPFYSR